MKKPLLAIASLCAIVTSATAQQNQRTLLSEIQARQKAIELLISWQWGRTKAQALRHIKKTEFIPEDSVSNLSGNSQLREIGICPSMQ
jgi:hypothetical protein